LLAAARDPQRRAARLEGERSELGTLDVVVRALEGRDSVGPQLLEDLHALVEHREALARTGEPVAVGAPLVLVPAGTDTHLDPAARDDVGRRRDLREVGGVAVRHARAHLTESHPA